MSGYMAWSCQVSRLLLCKEGVGKIQWGAQSSLAWLAASSSSAACGCASRLEPSGFYSRSVCSQDSAFSNRSLSSNSSEQAVSDIYRYRYLS